MTGDVRTMAVHLKAFVAQKDSPGVILIPPSRSIAEMIDSLIFVWLHWTEDEVKNRVCWLPKL